jgi:hypothetical protein
MTNVDFTLEMNLTQEPQLEARQELNLPIANYSFNIASWKTTSQGVQGFGQACSEQHAELMHVRKLIMEMAKACSLNRP